MNKNDIDISHIVGDNFFANVEKALMEVVEETTVRIPYDRFVSEMLPYFAGAKEDDNFYAYWVNFVGGVNVRANVIRDDQVVLSIDPMASSLKLKHNDTSVSPNEVFSEYETMVTINPAVAQQRLQTGMSGWFQQTSLPELYYSLYCWDRILTENGYDGYDLSDMELAISDDELAQMGLTRGGKPLAPTDESTSENIDVEDGFDW